jgi:hypothetical protein
MKTGLRVGPSEAWFAPESRPSGLLDEIVLDGLAVGAGHRGVKVHRVREAVNV